MSATFGERSRHAAAPMCATLWRAALKIVARNSPQFSIRSGSSGSSAGSSESDLLGQEESPMAPMSDTVCFVDDFAKEIATLTTEVAGRNRPAP